MKPGPSSIAFLKANRAKPVRTAGRVITSRSTEGRCSAAKSTPQKIIAAGTDWRFLNELKCELKA